MVKEEIGEIMAAILKVRDADGTVHEIHALQGKSAYQYAVEGGYAGTEAEFAAKLAAEKFANPNALTFTGAVTGSYDGSNPMTVKIPRGTINVKDFGAAGDGVTDDTAALQLAFDSTADQGGNLYIPEGDYKITGQLTIADPICVSDDAVLSAVPV